MDIIKIPSYNSVNYCYNRNIKYIVIHYTAGSSSAKGTARNVAAMFATPGVGGSADFIVDDSEVVQFNPDLSNYLCWHCGDPRSYTKGGSLYGICTNANSVGIEICSTNPNCSPYDPANSPKWRFSTAAVDRAVELTKYLMEKYKVPADRVVRHYDVSGKLCPGIIGWNADSGSEAKWLDFKKRIGAAAKATATATTAATASDKKTIYRVQVGSFLVEAYASSLKDELKKKGFSDAFITKASPYRVQCGAFSSKKNAEALKEKLIKAGYKNAIIATSETAAKKTDTEVAKEVIAGKWGVGADRKARLTAAGYDYTAVQAEVNRMLEV